MEGTEKKRHIRKRTIYAVILAVMLICLVMIVFLLLFQVRRIDVKGNEYLSSQEVADWLQEDDLAQNSLYEVKVGMKNPWTLEVTVTEKRIAGYITMGDDAVYFDKDGIVLAVTTEWWDNVPRIDGLSVDQVTLYKELPVSEENRQIFSSLLEMSQSLKQSDLSPDRIVCGGDGLYLFFGNVCVSLGDSNFSDRIAQIPPILEKLGDQTGTLHLENYGESSTTVSFRRDEIPQFESQTEEQ